MKYYEYLLGGETVQHFNDNADKYIDSISSWDEFLNNVETYDIGIAIELLKLKNEASIKKSEEIKSLGNNVDEIFKNINNLIEIDPIRAHGLLDSNEFIKKIYENGLYNENKNSIPVYQEDISHKWNKKVISINNDPTNWNENPYELIISNKGMEGKGIDDINVVKNSPLNRERIHIKNRLPKLTKKLKERIRRGVRDAGNYSLKL